MGRASRGLEFSLSSCSVPMDKLSSEEFQLDTSNPYSLSHRCIAMCVPGIW